VTPIVHPAACDADCTPVICGDGTLNLAAGEECDDGNNVNADGCEGDCTNPFCGNGIVDPPDEDCDDGGESAFCNIDCTPAVCGDGKVNATAGEECDDSGESVSCDIDCTPAVCGDGMLNATSGEQCDDNNVIGGDGCSAICLNEVCGNGIVDPAEDCDDVGESATCDADCTTAGCGDGTINTTAGEICDDGGESPTCDADCTPAVCGDGTHNAPAGEQCDDGGESAACDVDCTPVICGDGMLNVTAGEECDDGNNLDADGCEADCTTPFCGNNIVDPPEQCDDGGESATCDVDCTPVSCGDGTLNVAAGEECDDGNNIDADGCEADCSNPFCGNGIVDPPEQCDDVGESFSCDSDCTPAVCGDGLLNVTAGEECDDNNNVDSDGCEADCTNPFCGNSIVDPPEECDDGGESPVCDADCTGAACGDGVINSSAGEQCDDSGESPTCDVNCTPVICGDGTLNASAGEECDDGNNVDADGCEGDCTNPFCGNLIVDPPEECDDGVESATCDVDCTSVACGDGTLNTTAGEQCDDGGESATCDTDCTPAVCGDGMLNVTAGEECDDNNNIDSDGCEADCTNPFCGNGIVDPPEVCDDVGESDTCDPDCTPAVCGDGTLNTTSGEECDDNNNIDADGCEADCTNPYCGNNIVDPPEQCDDGVETATCDIDCTPAVCGDGMFNPTSGELCDDGGESATCDSDCTPAVCGDGVRNSTRGEQCDDGNTANGDCCSSTCEIESSSTVCRAAADVCDDPDYCTGSTPDCPTDTFLSGSTLCRGTAGVCDTPDYCTGSSAACPPDAFLGGETECRPGHPTDPCDPAEFCSGSSVDCPDDAVLPDLDTCTDDLYPCTDDICLSGVCWHVENNACGACAFLDGSCVNETTAPNDGPPYACTGLWAGPGTACLGTRGCCHDPVLQPEFAPYGCIEVDLAYCASVAGSIRPAGVPCQGDGNGDGEDDVCEGIAFAPCESFNLTASDAAAGDSFGYSVAIDGDYAMSGARLNDDAGSNSGAAYIYIRGPARWVERAKLVAGDAASGDMFGNSTDISGSFAIVGANQDDDDGNNSGAAYIFHSEGAVWPEQAKLTAGDAAGGDQFGWSVAISGDYAIVGAPYNSDAGYASGSAYIFVRQGINWVQQAKLTASNATAVDQFGFSVTIDGEYAVVAAPSNSSAGADAGAVYVFHRSGTNWLEQPMIVAGDAVSDGGFGADLAINAGHMLIGSRANGAYFYSLDDNNTPADPNDDSWVFEQKLTASDGWDGDRYGTAVAISGTLAVVGAFGNADAGPSSGSAYLYQWDGAVWTNEEKLTPADLAESDSFGFSVGVGPTHVFVGSYKDDDRGSESGSAYLFGLSGPDCNVNGVVDECDVASGASNDCNEDGALNECQGERADSDADGITDDCDMCPGFDDNQDTDGDSVPDGCDICEGLDDKADCDADGVPDCSAIANCGGDLACSDCNGNNMPDGCEVDNGTVSDCNENSIPDMCDIAGGTSLDCAGEGVPDECEPDCNTNGSPDSCDIMNCPVDDLSCTDCNGNGSPDGCDLGPQGDSEDLDGNGIPDECDTQPPLAAAAPHDARKNRYISFDPNNRDAAAFRLELVSMKRCTDRLFWTCRTDVDCPMYCAGSTARECTEDLDCVIKRCTGSNAICVTDADCPSGQTCEYSGTDLGPCESTGPCIEHPDVGLVVAWVGAPFDPSCQNEDGTPKPGSPPCLGEDFAASTVDAPVLRIWSENPVHVGGCEIIPVATYEVRGSADGIVLTQPLVVGTILKPGERHYGDTAGIGTGDLPPLPGFTPPNQIVNVADVMAFILTLKGATSPSAHTTWVDLHGLGTAEPVCSVSGTPCFDDTECPDGESCVYPPNGVPPDFILNVSDLQRIIFGFEGRTWAETPGHLNPADCP
jgi:cysteine-rich repeat protein